MMDHKKTILLVEDEGIIALAERRSLERFGYAVLVAYSGEEAVATAHARADLDLILMDINLGSGMDGTAAASAILAEREIPLIFLSAHTEPDIVLKTEGISSYGYLVKSAGETVLAASIRMAFRLFEAKRGTAEKSRELEEANAKLLARNRELLWWDERTRHVVRHSPIAIAVLDRDMRYVYVSDRWISDYRLKDTAIIGLSHYEIFPEIPAGWREVHQMALRGEILHGEEEAFPRADGGLDYVTWDCRPWRTSNGEIGGIILYTDVVTERCVRNLAIQRRERLYSAIMDSMQDIVFTLDRNKRHSGVYGPWVGKNGMKPEDFLGKTFAEILGPEAARVHEAAFDRALSGEYTIYEWTAPGPDGERRFQTSLSPIRLEDGSVDGLVGVGREMGRV